MIINAEESQQRITIMQNSNDVDTNKSALLPLAFAALWVAGLSLCFWWLNKYDAPLNPDILSPHVSILHMQSTTFQRLAYLSMLALGGLLALAALLLPASALKRMSDSSLSLLIGGSVVAIVACAGFSNSSAYKLTALAMFALFAIAALPVLRQGRNRSGQSSHKNGKLMLIAKLAGRLLLNQKLMGLMMAVIVILLWIFPLFTFLTIHDLAEFVWVDGHYTVTLLGGFDLVCCEHLGEVARLYYGMGMPLLTAAYLEVARWLGFPGTNLVIAVKLFQGLALFLVLAILRLRNSSDWLLWGLLAIVLTSFTLSNVGIAIPYPNQSGLRFIPLLLALLAYAAIIDQLYKNTYRWLAGGISAVLVWLNPETGLALAASSMLVILLDSYSRHHRLLLAIGPVLEYSSMFVLGLAVLFGFFSPILVADIKSPADFLLLFGGAGYGGLKDKLSLSAAVLLLVGLYSILAVILDVRRHVGVDANQRWRVLIAGLILIWHCYYVNRMAEWNLWFNWILLVFLIATFSRASSPREMVGRVMNLFRPTRLTARWVIAALVTIVSAAQSAYSVYTTANQIKKTVLNWRPACANDYPYFGVCLDQDPGKIVQNFLDQLQIVDPKSAMVLTEMPTTVRVSGYNDGQPFYSVFDAVNQLGLARIRLQVEQFHPSAVVWPRLDGPLAQVRGGAFSDQMGLVLDGMSRGQSIEHLWIQGFYLNQEQKP